MPMGKGRGALKRRRRRGCSPSASQIATRHGSASHSLDDFRAQFLAARYALAPAFAVTVADLLFREARP